MARDYKHRANTPKKSPRSAKVGSWQWMLVFGIVAMFVVFLIYISFTGSKEPEVATPAAQTPATAKSEAEKKPTAAEAKKAEETAAQEKKPEAPKPPRFDFYTVLPEKEVVISEHEIKTLSREERVGKAKEGKYVLQAASHETFKETDELRAKLALMGIESKIEKAKVGDKVWYRVKMGPYTQMASIDALKTRLKKSGIDTILTTEASAKKAPAASTKPVAPAAPAKTNH